MEEQLHSLEKLDVYKNIAASEVTQTLQNLDYDNLIHASDLILNAIHEHHRVHITGVGKPSYVAGYIASLLSSLGIPSYFLDTTETIHGSSGQVWKDDIVIAISNSGETKELQAAIHTLSQNGALIIGLSSNNNSFLARHSHLHLCAKVTYEGDDLNMPPRMSIIAELITLQALSILLQSQSKLTLDQYKKWHPGGSLGKKAAQILEKSNNRVEE